MPSMKNCPDAETLGAFIDGSLTGDALRSVTEHLASCEECMAVMSAARFRDERGESCESDEVERKPVEIASHPRFGRTRLVAIAATVVVLAGLGAVIGLSLNTTPSPRD
jgi:anti-sigma factor RsiW